MRIKVMLIVFFSILLMIISLRDDIRRESSSLKSTRFPPRNFVFLVQRILEAILVDLINLTQSGENINEKDA